MRVADYKGAAKKKVRNGIRTVSHNCYKKDEDALCKIHHTGIYVDPQQELYKYIYKVYGEIGLF